MNGLLRDPLRRGMVLAFFAVNTAISTALAQGSLTPPGAPAPTMKSLAQIEPRTPISAAPFTITNSGSYYLTTNLTVSSGSAILISTNGVLLDLNGFTLRSTSAGGTDSAILIAANLRNLIIQNGFVDSGVTNNGGGVYSGNGFANGISAAYNAPVNTLVRGVLVAGVLNTGIMLANGDGTLVESCTVRTAGGYGIVAITVKDSVAQDCGGTAIYGHLVVDCRGESSGSGYGISAAYNARDCIGTSSGSSGVHACTAEHCVGYSYGGSGGVDANCALNCYAYSASGNGLNAAVAENCFGYSYGAAYGLSASTSASGCYGYSSSGTGLYAFIANVCHGGTSTGTAMSVTHNVNSF